MDDELEATSCETPGRNGCQACDECVWWGDDEYHRLKEDDELDGVLREIVRPT